MATKWRNFSHSIITKIIIFIIVLICFSSAITIFFNFIESNNAEIDIVLEESYYTGKAYIIDLNSITSNLTQLIRNYKSEEYILSGGTIEEHDLEREKGNLFSRFMRNSKSYNPNLSHDENYKIFEEVYADKILQVKKELIEKDLKEWNSYLQRLQNYEGLIYYGSDGENVFTNSPNNSKEYFKTYSSYIIFDKSEEKIYPQEIKNNPHYYWIQSDTSQLEQQDHSMYIAFTNEFLNARIEKWKRDKVIATDSLYKIAGFLLGLLLTFTYLILVIGRKSFKDNNLHLNFVDKLFNDINIVLCLGIIASWLGAMGFVFDNNLNKAIFPITFLIGALGLILVLSLIKHIKNRTFIKHTLIYSIFNKLFDLIKDIYDSGSIGIKIVLLITGYSLITSLASFMLGIYIDDFIPAILTFFIFSTAIGVALWLALKKVKAFNAIKEGVEKIKDGDIHHTINVLGNGEFSKLATNINSIADGLNKAVANELKSERLKTELISNVSHDIRTPLTSIITYIDLLKKEGLNSENADKYLDVLDQKSIRLKTLTDDLFEASKASSGNIPVNLEKIDITSILTQGMGELDDKIASSGLNFKFNYPKEKVFVKADGKLLWRVIENLMFNIFKYALESSRVYIDVIDSHNNASIIIKNISSYELNIDSNELMERFKRGDESRNSEGSGLGLSIAKSLVELQNGKFNIEIDGDLFKAIIVLPKH